MTQTELEQHAAWLRIRAGWASEDLVQGRGGDDHEALPHYLRELNQVERELAAFQAEQEARDLGLPETHYVVTTGGTLQVRGSDGTVRELRCPRCDANRAIEMHATGDAHHSTSLLCPNGHEWRDPDVTYLGVRDALDLSRDGRSDIELFHVTS